MKLIDVPWALIDPLVSNGKGARDLVQGL